MGDTVNIDGEEVDLSKLTERQQIALLLKQSEEEARKPSQSSRARKPPSTPRSRSKDDTAPSVQHCRPPSLAKREHYSHAAYEEFAHDSAPNKDGLWTPREHSLFMQIVESHGGAPIKWSDVGEKMGGRTEQQCAEYMQRLLDRGLLTDGEIPAKPAHHHSDDLQPEPKRTRTTLTSPTTRARANIAPTYRRTHSEELPPLLPKVPQEEIRARAKALLKIIEQDEARLAQAVSESEPPELAHVAPQDEEAATQEQEPPNEALDPELVAQQLADRDDLQARFDTEMQRLGVWFRENCNREAFEGDEDTVPAWDAAMVFVKSNQCLAPLSSIPTPPPPKKRLSKLLRQFEQVKGLLVKKQLEESKTMAMVHHWRASGCNAPQPNEEFIQQVPDPSLLSLPAHIRAPDLASASAAVKVQFPFYIKTRQ